ncbi:uncharacterized protein CDAR_252901 [Caerostris darwini]|uniref:Protein kinase domain-containing protein n=1 Tax=Caerostris darwini TaxID=1538125 RepID=A0AAV4Q3I6_9ARAC|nr:uncharacterized protein CDAR_252901 [Caerostris darwini]
MQGIQKKNERKEVKISKFYSSLQARPNIKNIERLIEEEIEFAFWKKKLTKPFRKELERYPLLAKAVYLGCERAVDDLLEAGESVNERILDGSTPLMIAVDKGHVTIVQKLLKMGADMRLTQNDGHTILTIAVERGFVEYAKFFSGLSVVKVDHQTKEGRSALMLAAMRSQPEIVKCLLERGASVLLEDKVHHKGLITVHPDLDTATSSDLKFGEGGRIFRSSSLSSFEGHSGLRTYQVYGFIWSMNYSLSTSTRTGHPLFGNPTHHTPHIKTSQAFKNGGTPTVGSTVLCIALVQKQPEIIEMLLETLNKKDRDIYVKKRIELLYRPRLCSNFEVTYFYKKILFRVLLAIKQYLTNGTELLFKYKIFFALIKCIEMNQGDPEILWQAFHLSACLMYNSVANNSYVLKDMAELYAESKGQNFSLKIMTCSHYKNNSDVRDAAFMPIQACCVGCYSGRLWLKDNHCRIMKYVNEFRSNLPVLKFWLKSEVGKAKIIFELFEVMIQRIATEEFDSNFGRDMALSNSSDLIDSYECSSVDNESLEDDFESSSAFLEIKPPSRNLSMPSTTSVKLQVKKKAEAQRKVKNLKFHAKFDKKNTMNTVSQMKNVNFFPTVSSKKINCATLDSQTGYADALKRNLNCKSEEEVKVEQFAAEDNENPQKVNADNDSLLNQVSPCRIENMNKNYSEKQRIHWNSTNDSSENIEDAFKSYASVTSQNNASKSVNEKVDTLNDKENNNKSHEIYSIWNEVKQPHKFLSLITKFYPMSNIPVSQVSSLETVFKDENQSVDISLHEEEEEGTEEEQTRPNLSFCEDGSSEDSIKTHEIIRKELETESTFSKKNIKQYHSPDLESKQKRIDVEAENLYCLLEGLNLDQNPTDINYIGRDMDFIKNHKRLNREQTNPKSVYVKENTTNDIIQFASNRSEQNDNDSNSNDPIISRRTYSDVARTNIDQIVENIKILPKTEINENEEANVFFKVKELDESNSNYHTDSLKNKLDCLQSEQESTEEQFITNTASKLRMETINKLKVNEDTEGKMPLPGCNAYQSRKDIPIENCNLENKQDPRMVKMTDNKETDEKVSESEESCTTARKGPKMVNLSIEKEKSWKKDCNLLDGSFAIDVPINTHFRLRCLKTIRQRVIALEDLNRPPIICKFKLLSLQKYLSLYQRLVHHSLREVQNTDQKSNPVKTDFDTLVTNIEYPLSKSFKKKITVFTKSNIIPQAANGAKNNNLVRTGIPHPEEPKFTNFLSNLSKVTIIKTPKLSNDSSQRKMAKLPPKNNSEWKRKTAREEEFIRRRALMSGDSPDNREVKNRYIDTGFPPHFINCESGSKWFTVLHNLKPCVPLSQFLLDPFSTEAANSSKSSNLHHIDSAVGNIVFCTKEECTLREGSFGTYAGLIVNNGTPICVREIGASSIVTDKAALSLSRRRLLKHERLTVFYDATISPKNFKMNFITELCEYSLPEYLKTAKINKYFPGPVFRKFLVIDLLEGIRYLHQKRIVHGHLKPSNILITTDHRLKIADYYLLDVFPLTWGIKILDLKFRPIGSNISEFCWRSTKLILAENEVDARAGISLASDVQLCGMLTFYILSDGKHPFGLSEQECQENIRQGLPKRLHCLESIEARDLVNESVKGKASERPSIEVMVSKPTRIAEEFKESCIEAKDWITSVSLSMTLLLLRCSLHCKKSQIFKVIRKLHDFSKFHQHFPLPSVKKYAISACVLSFLLPISTTVVTLIFVMTDVDGHRSMINKLYFTSNSTVSSEVLFGIMSVGLQILTAVHFFIFPALTMTLLSFIYSSYIDILKHRLVSTRQNLSKKVTQQTISEALDFLTAVRKIHGDIEDSVSFIAFLAYALTFENILNLVCIFSNDFLSSMVVLRALYTINNFLWTTVWFIVLTLCGSKTNCIGFLLKSLSQDIITHQNMDSKLRGNKELLYLHLLKDCSKLSLRFTGFGMFLVDKKLFLSTSGVLLTYGVLFGRDLRM